VKRWAVASFVILGASLVLVASFQLLAQDQALAQPGDCQTFRETGRAVCGKFLAYWREHGGLAQQGYPISNEFREVSDLDGKEYTVQYFERAVFELHPENQPPYDVLLSQLGTFQFRRKYPNGEPGVTPSTTASPSADAWAALRQRPMSLPTIAPGSSCPTTTGRPVAPDFGPAIGEGPLFAAGMGTEVAADLTSATEEGGWYYVKVLWIAESSFSGPALVRGRQLDGSNELRFDRGSPLPVELKLHTNDALRAASGWRNWPTYTRLRAPGCYAFQVDTVTATQVIVFKAVR
jgi:hypothetical protein